MPFYTYISLNDWLVDALNNDNTIHMIMCILMSRFSLCLYLVFGKETWLRHFVVWLFANHGGHHSAGWGSYVWKVRTRQCWQHNQNSDMCFYRHAQRLLLVYFTGQLNWPAVFLCRRKLSCWVLFLSAGLEISSEHEQPCLWLVLQLLFSLCCWQ